MNLSSTVTVLIPTFNRSKLLKRAIASVAQQSYPEVRIVVCDNASTDETESVVYELMSHDKRIQYFRHASNIGGLNNFRFAFAQVHTPFFSVLSDDDFLTRDFILDGVKVLNEFTNVGFVIQNTLFIDDSGALISTGGHSLSNELRLFCSDSRFDAFQNYEVPYIWTGMVFRGELSHLYEKDMQNDISHDFRFLFRAISKNNYAHLSKVGSFFTSHEGSMSSARPYFDMLQHRLDCTRYLEILEDPMVDESLKERVRYYLRKLANINPYRQALKEALRHLLKNCCNSPELPPHSVLKFAGDFDKNGFHKTASFFSSIYSSRSLRFLIKFSYQGYNNFRLRKNYFKMQTLQNTVYKSYFDDVKDLPEK
jgi:glycosyltransferase involved in cell wall biosynthesis